jgi:hypothetical protein
LLAAPINILVLAKYAANTHCNIPTSIKDLIQQESRSESGTSGSSSQESSGSETASQAEVRANDDQHEIQDHQEDVEMADLEDSNDGSDEDSERSEATKEEDWGGRWTNYWLDESDSNQSDAEDFFTNLPHDLEELSVEDLGDFRDGRSGSTNAEMWDHDAVFDFGPNPEPDMDDQLDTEGGSGNGSPSPTTVQGEQFSQPNHDENEPASNLWGAPIGRCLPTLQKIHTEKIQQGLAPSAPFADYLEFQFVKWMVERDISQGSREMLLKLPLVSVTMLTIIHIENLPANVRFSNAQAYHSKATISSISCSKRCPLPDLSGSVINLPLRVI